MSKTKKLLTAVISGLLLCSGTGLAKNNVSDIDISVTVREDGSAYIVQNWQGTFHEGTENYIPINTENISISDLKVSDETGAYTLVDTWNVNLSFEEKARKCGYNKTTDGVELCFGISEYGENRYAIEYVVEDFIKSYADFDGTNFMFVNPDMSTFPTNGTINIVLQNGTQLDESNAGIWAFGFDGYIEFQNGSVRAYTESALYGKSSMIVMLRLNKGIISPKTQLSESFESVREQAFEGSNYGYEYEEEATLFEIIFGLLVMFAFWAGLIGIAGFLIRRKKAIKKFYKEAEYFREIPNDGKIEVSHYLAQTFDVANEKSLIIGTLILSMINKGSIEPETDERVGFFGNIKESVNLKLIKEPDTSAELLLYQLLLRSAGEDGILQEKELEKYAYKHPEEITSFLDNIKNSGEREFITNGGFTDGAGNCIKDLSEQGKYELAEIMGLKKYLEDFTLIAERSITETIIWKEYIIYATLFGIAEKVMKQFEALYPEKMPEFESYNRNVIIAHSYYHSMHRSAQRAIQAQRTSGGGGRASFGGGGGFSGGGHGGGSR